MQTRHPRLAATAVAIAALLAGCASMAPTYERPASPVPAQWPTGAAYASASAASAAPTTAADIPWQSFILDARLRNVVELALGNSRDLRKTIASIQSARAQYRLQDAALLPTVDASVGGSQSRSVASGNANGNTTSRSKSVSATAGISSYELDLFGRVRSLSNAELETYLATTEASRSTRLSLVAETATAWLTLAADRSLLAISQQTLDAAQSSMEVTRQRLDAGVATLVDVRSAETVYQQARSDVASHTTAIAQDRNALELLVGAPVRDELLPQALPPATGGLADVPAGLSSTVLLQRPDVLEAEHQLKSANADIGAARAAFFPTLSLTATGGVASAALSTLLTGGATVWTLAPALSVPIFDGGAHQASLAYAHSQRDLYVASYELAVQTAFKEVADALARRGTMTEQLSAQTALVAAASDSATLANARYAQGIDTFLVALESQRTLYSAQQTLVSTQLTALENRVTLYQVLGGGMAAGG